MEFKKYNCIDTKEGLRDLNRFLIDASKGSSTPQLALDTETNGLHVHNSTVVGISLAVSQDQGFYIPLLQWECDPETKRDRSKDGVKYKGTYKDGWLKCVWSGQTFPEFVTPKEYKIREIMPAIPILLEKWIALFKLLMWNVPFDANMLKTSFGVDITSRIALDGSLLVHALDENFTVSLKGNIPKYAVPLGMNAHAAAAIEKQEMYTSIIRNGGNKAGEVWRASPVMQSKYACADAFLTYGICKAALAEFAETYGRKGLQWFFKSEVMPLCKEVIVDLKYHGMYTDVPHFEGLWKETHTAMEKIEDELITHLTSMGLLQGFPLGTEESVSTKRMMLKLLDLEDLAVPTRTDKKTGKKVQSLAKKAVQEAYDQNPHWVYGYILGTDELRYSPEKMKGIAKELFYFHENKDAVKVRKPLKRHRFNLNSADHLRWLFVKRLGMDARLLPTTESSTSKNVIPSMAADVLTEHMLPNYSWVQKLLVLKKLIKLESTYVRPVLMLNTEGWVYANFKQNGTGSGRGSCSGGINLQTLPRADDETHAISECEKCGSEDVVLDESISILTTVWCEKCTHLREGVVRPSVIKKGFVAPPGYVIVTSDFTSLEPKCFAEMSGSKALMEVYLQGLDLYSFVYCKMFDPAGKYSADPGASNYLKKLAKKLRNFAKVFVLSIPYGASAAAVATQIGAMIDVRDKETGLMIKIPDMKEGARVRDLYLSTFPELADYMEEREQEAANIGYVDTKVGRRRHLPKAFAIQTVLKAHGMDFKDLMGCSAQHLKTEHCSPVSKDTGVRLNLTREMLYEIRDELGIKRETLDKKGHWALIRGLLKGDLNLAKNHPIQGLAAHITNLGMLKTARELKLRDLDAICVMQVHDEIILYARKGVEVEVSQVLQAAMEQNIMTDLVTVPMEAPPVVGANLAEAK